MIKEIENILERVAGKDPEDMEILEDIRDTFDAVRADDLKERLDAITADYETLKTKYRERFYKSDEPEPKKEPEPEEVEEKTEFEDLFK